MKVNGRKTKEEGEVRKKRKEEIRYMVFVNHLLNLCGYFLGQVASFYRKDRWQIIHSFIYNTQLPFRFLSYQINDKANKSTRQKKTSSPPMKNSPSI